jgi:hypothetical protein
MKKIIVFLFVLIISMSCLSGTAVTKTEVKATPVTEKATQVPTTGALPPTATSLPPTAVPTLIPTIQPTETLIPPTETPDPFDVIHERIADYHSNDLDDLVDQFSSGKYYTLDDYSNNGAKAKSLYRFPYDISPIEFLAITDVSWEHPTTNINKSTAGCGYSFYDDEDAGQIYYVLFTLDNYARLTQVRNNYWDGIAHVKDNSLNLASPNGSAQIMLVILENRVVFAVNGKIMIDQTVDWQSKGKFGYSLLSGTYKDYGTRCYYKNTVLLVNK